LGIPAIGVSSLQAMAYTSATSHLTMATLDARQGNLYCQLFNKGGEAIDEPRLCAATDISNHFPQGTPIIVGHNSAALADQLGMTHADAPPIKTVESIAQIAANRTPDGTRPAPMYLRPADAAPPRDPAPKIL
ncbi:MAG: hypothetical protein ABJJ01_00020, partial [Marinomonas sp.]